LDDTDLVQLAAELWPETEEAKDDDDSDAEPDEGLSIEAQIANKVSAMKRPRKEQRFSKPATSRSLRPS
jgi:tRNA acetyltransferase TAN1